MSRSCQVRRSLTPAQDASTRQSSAGAAGLKSCSKYSVQANGDDIEWLRVAWVSEVYRQVRTIDGATGGEARSPARPAGGRVAIRQASRNTLTAASEHHHSQVMLVSFYNSGMRSMSLSF